MVGLMQGENVYIIFNKETHLDWAKTFSTREEAQRYIDRQVELCRWSVVDVDIRHYRIPY
jgi:hypothetical protein